MTGLGEQFTSGHHTFNVVNPHDDGISLDTFVDWLTESGRPITRVDDYHDWLERFPARLCRHCPSTAGGTRSCPCCTLTAAPAEATGGAMVPAERFRAAVQDTDLGWDGDIPHIGPELIKKYLTDLESLGIRI
ncbi:hypothetical protein [Streptomyces sp. KL116D]|uniref:hypothetical protein n=1 Tax=Streptomyces sp. KL116D TaxID=3045152 RepID=UPI003556AFDA